MEGGGRIRITNQDLQLQVMVVVDRDLGPNLRLQKVPSDPGGGGSGDGDEDDPDLPDLGPDGPNAPSVRSSTVATSEVRSMLKRRARRDDQQSRPKSSLGSVKIEEYYGDRSRYLKWKKAI